MSVHTHLLQRSAAKREIHASAVQFQADGESAVAVTAVVGPESVEERETADGRRELMRVRTVEYKVVDVPGCRVQRDRFVIDGEAWTVNQIPVKGSVTGVAEVVRPERAEKAGRGRFER